MVTHAKAALDGNHNIAYWWYEVWSHTHATRPAPAGNLMPAWHLETPFTQPVPKPIPQPEGDGDRNAIPLYKLSNARVIYHFAPTMPLRVSALRSLGAYMNIFSIESFMDELAQAAHVDPIDFRLRHLEDPRARNVITAAVSVDAPDKGFFQSGVGDGRGACRTLAGKASRGRGADFQVRESWAGYAQHQPRRSASGTA